MDILRASTFALKMETICLSETLLSIHNSARRYNVEDHTDNELSAFLKS
jgi:hypothetical protein